MKSMNVVARSGRAGRWAGASDGTTAAEYAVLIGMVVGVLAIGATLLGRQTERAMSRLSKSDVASGSETALSTSRNVRSEVPAGNVQERWLSPTQVERYSSYALMTAFGGIAMALAGTVVERRRRKKSATPVERPADGEPVEQPTHDRLHDKRWWLWHTLVNDSDLVLRNRVEVQHLMTRELTIVGRNTSVDDMRALMKRQRVRHLLVCDPDARLLGVVSDRDLCTPGENLVAEQVMTTEPNTVSPSTVIGAAIGTMTEQGISCLPVIEDDRVCGLLTTTDLVLTLQCMLQLWLRLGDTMRDNAEWAKRIDAISAMLDHSLTA